MGWWERNWMKNQFKRFKYEFTWQTTCSHHASKLKWEALAKNGTPVRTENDPAPQKQKCIDIGFSFFMIRRVVVYDANNGENKNSPSPQAVTKTRLSRPPRRTRQTPLSHRHGWRHFVSVQWIMYWRCLKGECNNKEEASVTKCIDSYKGVTIGE